MALESVIMKSVFFFLAMLIFMGLMAPARAAGRQTDTVPSTVYKWNNAKIQKSAGRESRQILKGSTRDLANLGIHASTLEPGVTNHPPAAYSDREELLIVKQGQLKATINGTSKVLGPGGLALIVAGDEQSFQNVSDKPATYYIIAFQTKVPVNIQRGRDSGGSLMKDWGELEVKQTDKGESRPIFDRPSSLFERFDIHATALNPGFASHLPHTHRAEEIILMIKGTGESQIGNKFYEATAGDIVFYSSQIPHAIKNKGTEQCGYFAIQWHVKRGD